MFSEPRISLALEAVMNTIEAPPVPLASIRERAEGVVPAPVRRAAPLALPAAAAVVVMLLAIAVPLAGSGFVQSVEAQIEALLRWKPPPPAPPAVWSAMRQVPVTLAQARARVSFTLVPPAGIPRDVLSRLIYAAPPGVYSKKTHRWSVGAPIVTFVYRRAGGRLFSVGAGRFDPAEGPPSKYRFEDMDRSANGREVILRRDVFTWRNGNQAMTATTGEGIDAAEIAAIRRAMHGVTIPGVWPSVHNGTVKQYRMP